MGLIKRGGIIYSIMKYCYNCGKALEDEHMFCLTCGKRQPEINESNSIQIQFGEKKNHNKLYICILGLIVAVIILIAAFWGLNKTKNVTTSKFNDSERTTEKQEEFNEDINELNFDEIENKESDENKIIPGDDRVKNEGCRDLPQLYVSSIVLNESFETLKLEKGYYLQGPEDFYQDLMSSEFGLVDFEGIDCYGDTQASNITIYGVKNNKIVFYAVNGLTSDYTVKDIIPSDCWSIQPRIFNAQKDDYVWKLENGYLIVNVFPRDVGLTDQIVNSVVYTSELGGFALSQSSGVPYE